MDILVSVSQFEFGVVEAQVTRLWVRIGQPVRKDDVLASLETDIGTYECSTPTTGVVAAIFVKEHNLVRPGDKVAAIHPLNEFQLPDLGEGIVETDVVRILVQAGAQVKTDQPLLEVETDKAGVEIPSPIAGIVREIRVKENTTIRVGDVVLVLDPVTDDPRTIIGAQNTHNIRIGLVHLAQFQIKLYCLRTELLQFTFEPMIPFLRKVRELATEFLTINFEHLTKDAADSLRIALHRVQRHTKNLERYKPDHNRIDTAYDNHSSIMNDFRETFRDDLLAFHEAFARVAPGRQFSTLRLGGAYVFLSYSHLDARGVDEFCRKLDANEVEYFRDTKRIKWGEPIDEKVRAALRKSTHLVMFLTSGSRKSEWVPYEVGFAEGKNAVIVPYRTSHAEDIPGFLRGRKGILPENVDEFIADLVAFGGGHVDT